MTYQCFDLRISDKVAHLVLNRPSALNTMQPVMWRELTAILQMLQREAPARTGNLVENFIAKQQGRAPEFDDLPPLKSFAEGKYELK